MAYSSIPEFIDIHAHTNFSVYESDRVEVVNRSLDAKTWIINVGTQKVTSKKAVEMTEEFPRGVYATIGLHPINVNPSFNDKNELDGENKFFSLKGENFDINYYRDLANHPKVVGIGECGLDYFREQSEEGRNRQIDAFKGQIDLSIELGLPLMLHVRNAYKEVIDILKKYPGAYGNCHFFAGTIFEAQEFLDLGFTLSFTGVITFAKQYEELVRYVPSDKIISETDCPYVAPMPYRGKRNEPLYVREIVTAMAKIRSEDPLVLQKQLVDNAIRLFRLLS